MCYYCPINEEIAGSVCACRSGFTRDPVSSICVSSACRNGAILIGGLCATCVGGTVYDAQLRACVCLPGFYLNTFGFCEVRVAPPVQCSLGFYSSQGSCLPCGRNCATCQSAAVCLTCLDRNMMTVNGGECTFNNARACGNGVIEVGEQCDDRNLQNGDGCNMLCAIENGYQCRGSPSVCSPIILPLNLCGNGRPDP